MTDEVKLPDVWIENTFASNAKSVRVHYIPAARIDALEAELNRAFDELGMLGVPRERARTVANGINVLMTRISKSESAMLSELEAARADAARFAAALRSECNKHKAVCRCTHCQMVFTDAAMKD